MTVTCKKCKHVLYENPYTLGGITYTRAECTQNVEFFDNVEGKNKYYSARVCRGSKNMCGPSGSKFEYAGVFGKACANCHNYYKPDDMCGYGNNRIPIMMRSAAVAKHCGPELKNHQRSIWLTVKNIF